MKNTGSRVSIENSKMEINYNFQQFNWQRKRIPKEYEIPDIYFILEARKAHAFCHEYRRFLVGTKKHWTFHNVASN